VAKKKVLFLKMGPPRLAPYWLRRNFGLGLLCLLAKN
jgi:hypothetical protein